MAPRLSIVVPFFNVEPYIVSCLQSLQRQYFGDFEVILVNDGSTDGSAALAEGFVRSDNRFRMISQENQGLGPARNAGVLKAQGVLLTFVDSDDLVPRYAYERLIGSLDTTGSDLAAGDARRFNALGVWDSYTHREPFESRRLATHVSEFPALALDRMAWNKVYRREFWDANGLEFPAMLYEDYPVTIKGHVRARQVDILSDAVYYWRERDGGELSITQRHWKVANLRDRVVSAEMVLDILQKEAPYALETVQGHLDLIDFSAIAAAVQESPADDVPAILELADRLSSRIPAHVRAKASPFKRVQYHLLAKRQIAELYELVRYRADQGTSAPVVWERGLRTRYYLDLPFRDDRKVGVPRELYRVDPDDLELVACIEDAEWVDGMLHLEVTAAPRLVPMGDNSNVSVWLEDEGGRQIHCRVTRHHKARPHIGKDLSGLRVIVSSVAFEGRGTAFWRMQVRVKTSSGVTRQGAVKSTAPTRGRWVDGYMLSKSLWLEPRMHKDGFGIWAGRRPQWVAHCTDFGQEIEVSGGLRAQKLPGQVELVLIRGGEAHRRYPVYVVEGKGRVHDFTVRVPVADLAADSEHDLPVDELTAWAARLSLDGGLKPLAIHPHFTGAVSTLGDRSVMATRDLPGMFTLLEGHARPSMIDVRWVGRARLEFIGVTQDPSSLAAGLLLRRWLTPTEVVKTPVDVELSDGIFRFEVDVHVLMDLADQVEGSVHTEGRSPTPWHVVAADTDRPVNVVIAGDLAARTAGPRLLRGHTVRIQIEGWGAVRLLVD